MADLNFVSPRAQQAAAAQQTVHHHNQYHQHSQMGFNPLQGVPFEINPLYNASLQADMKSDLIVSYSLFLYISKHWLKDINFY